MKILAAIVSFSFVLLVPFFLYWGVMLGMVVEGMFFAYLSLLVSLVVMMKTWYAPVPKCDLHT